MGQPRPQLQAAPGGEVKAGNGSQQKEPCQCQGASCLTLICKPNSPQQRGVLRAPQRAQQLPHWAAAQAAHAAQEPAPRLAPPLPLLPAPAERAAPAASQPLARSWPRVRRLAPAQQQPRPRAPESRWRGPWPAPGWAAGCREKHPRQAAWSLPRGQARPPRQLEALPQQAVQAVPPRGPAQPLVQRGQGARPQQLARL
jgi:hypothetical protein